MRYFVIDTETVGLKTPELPASGVVQVAWVEIDKDLNVLSEHSHYVNPGCPIDPKASEVHGVYDDDVKDCPTLAQVMDLGTDPITLIGHNVAFDYRFLSNWIYPGKVQTLCTLQMARLYVKHSANHKLATLVKHLEIPQDKAHSALGDVRMTNTLLKVLLHMGRTTLEDAVAREQTNLLMHRMPFGKHKGDLMMELPKPYVRWMLDQDDLPPTIRRSLEHFVRLV